jgi:hypothetical protein
MSDFYKVLKETILADLGLSQDLQQLLKKEKIQSAYDLYKKLMTVNIMGTKGWPGITPTQVDFFQDLIKKITKMEKISSISPLQSPKTKPSNIKSQGKPNNQNSLQTMPTIAKKSEQNYSSAQVPPKEKTLPNKNISSSSYHTHKLQSQDGFENASSIENRLSVQLKKARLIGEINPGRELVNQLGAQFKTYFAQGSQNEILNIIKVDFPNSFLTFMVGMGIYEYDLKGLWPAITETLGLSSQAGLGQTFEELLNQFGFPRFEKLRDQSMRYITPLIMHGGIPIYSLDDFFEFIVLPSLQKPEYIGLSGQKLIDEMLERISVQVNKPVQYFLTYGGETASDLLTRSRKMAKAWLDSKEKMTSETAGLPIHIVDAFYEWVVKNENQVSRSHASSRQRLQKPELCLDPWGLGIFIRLPEQKLLDESVQNVEWNIDCDGLTKNLPAQIRRQADKVVALERLFIPTKICGQYRIELTIEENKFSWVLQGLNTEKPYLVFNPDQDPAPTMRDVFARQVWLMLPLDAMVEVVGGQANCLEVFPDLPGIFGYYRAEWWDFSIAEELSLKQQGKESLPITLRRQEIIPQPKLIGGTLLNDPLFQDEENFYIGKAPKLYLPTTSEFLSLDQWSLSFSTNENNTPIKYPQISLIDLPEDALERQPDNSTLVNLNQEYLLGENPYGKFEIHVKGPLGMDADLNLNILSGLKAVGLEKTYMAEEGEGSPLVHTSLEHLQGDHIEPANQQDKLWTAPKSSRILNVDFQPKRHNFDLVYVHRLINQDAIRIPFHIRVKRFRWRFVSGESVDENWNEWPIFLSVHDFQKAQTPFLLLDLPIQEEELLSMNLEITDLNGEIIKEQILFNPQKKYHTKRFWRIDLSSLSDLINLTDLAMLRGQLVIQLSSHSSPRKVPILRISKQLDLEIQEVRVSEDNEYYQIEITWYERNHQKNRVVYFWSTYRDWEEPFMEILPDNAVDSTKLYIPKKSLPGCQYQVHIDVRDPWLPINPTSCPDPLVFKNVKVVDFQSPSKRLIQLKNNLLEYNQFSGKLEGYLLAQSLDLQNDYMENLIWCSKHLHLTFFKGFQKFIEILSNNYSKEELSNIDTHLLSPINIKRLWEFSTENDEQKNEVYTFLSQISQTVEWSIESGKELAQFQHPIIQKRAINNLFDLDKLSGIQTVIKAMEDRNISKNEAMSYLYNVRSDTLQYLKENPSPFNTLVNRYLRDYNPLSGVKEVKVGTWVKTNVGWGKIQNIENLDTNQSVNSFYEGDGNYRFEVRLHIYESIGLKYGQDKGELVHVNLKKKEIRFLGKEKCLFQCPYCEHFISGNKTVMLIHLSTEHQKGHIEFSPIPISPIELTFLEYDFKATTK